MTLWPGAGAITSQPNCVCKSAANPVATVSRAMMEADPHAIVLCPYSVAVYKIPNDKHIYVAFRKPSTSRNPALKKALAEVEKLLTEIVKDAL